MQHLIKTHLYIKKTVTKNTENISDGYNISLCNKMRV